MSRARASHESGLTARVRSGSFQETVRGAGVGRAGDGGGGEGECDSGGELHREETEKENGMKWGKTKVARNFCLALERGSYSLFSAFLLVFLSV